MVAFEDSRLERLQEVFDRALDVPPQQRDAFVVATCGDDLARLSELRSLLVAWRDATGFLDRAVLSGADSGALQTGTSLGDFVIEEPLGRGGSGTVYRARQAGLERLVALKVQPLVELPGSRERALFEAKTAASFHHPHLAAVFSFGEDRGRGLAFYAMRLVEGVSVRAILERLARADQPPDAAVRHALVARCHEVCDALASLHERDMVHRDISPSNVILEGGHRSQPWLQPAVLIDFGLVRCTARVDATIAMGTPGYVAPEISAGETFDAKRADVFSLGALLHDLVAGRLPPAFAESAQLRLRCRSRMIGLESLTEVVPDVETTLSTIVARCTAVEPRERYASAVELKRVLASWLERTVAGNLPQLSDAAGRVAVKEQGSAPRVRSGQRVVGTAVLAMTIVVAACIGFWQSDMGLRAASTSEVRYGGGSHGDVRPSTSLGDLKGEVDDAWIADPGQRLAWHAVVREAARDLTAAQRLATRYLARDGRPAHPALIRFLLVSVCQSANNSASNSTALVEALRIVSRLLYEQPDANARDVVVSAPLREVLLHLVEASANTDIVEWALVALGGCATPKELEPLVRWVEQPRSDVAWRESVRLALRVIRSVIHRHRLCGFTAAIDGLDVDAVRRRLTDAIEVAFTECARRPLRVACEGVLGAVACFQRSVEVYPRAEEWSPVNAQPRVAALRRSPELHQQLQEQGPTAAGEGISPRYQGLFEFMDLVAAFGDDDWTTRMENVALARARDWGLDLEFTSGRMQTVVEATRRELRGEGAIDVIDPDSCLGRGLLPMLGLESLAAGSCRPGEVPHAFALCRFAGAQPEIGGEDVALRVRAATYERDETDPACGYLRLFAAGVSEVEMTFTVPPDPSSHFLTVSMHKGMRSGLPQGGGTRLEIRVDGVDRGHFIEMAGPSQLESDVPLSGLYPGRHVLTLRLSADSTTTLRLYPTFRRIG